MESVVMDVSEAPPGSENELVIEAGKPHRNYFSDVWRYRDLFYLLAWRDLRVRYAQTLVGSAWALIRPFMTMIVFTVIFGKLAKMPSEGVPYPILVFVGLLPWQLFSAIFSSGSNSLLSNSNLLTKVYFPRIILVFTSVLVAFVDFLISLMFLVLMMWWYSFTPGWETLAAPLFLGLAVITAAGWGIWISVLGVRYRDVIHIAPFILQLMQYVSPVGFSSSIIPQDYRLLYSVNPLVGVIDGFRWALLGGNVPLFLPGILVSFLISLGMLGMGIWYFVKSEESFADLI